MGIDLEKAKQEFIKYTANYDLKNDRIECKQTHSLRVMQISRLIAEGLKLSKNEIDLATLIGLLHDIARFEQYTKYNTYRDLESIDHGDLGAEILKKDIRKYIDTDKYDEIIVKAVKNHNKYQISKSLEPKEELFTKIVRDADKIDIYYESIGMFWKGKEKQVEESIISDITIQEFSKAALVRVKEKETPIDNITRVIALIFDINFRPSFQILKEEDYINRILNGYNLKDKYTKTKVEEIRKIANEYIDQKLREGK